MFINEVHGQCIIHHTDGSLSSPDIEEVVTDNWGRPIYILTKTGSFVNWDSVQRLTPKEKYDAL